MVTGGLFPDVFPFSKFSPSSSFTRESGAAGPCAVVFGVLLRVARRDFQWEENICVVTKLCNMNLLQFCILTDVDRIICAICF